MNWVKAVALAAGVVVVLGDLFDLLRALVVPRPYRGGPVAVFTGAMRAGYVWFAYLSSSPAWRDNVLAIGEPLVIFSRLLAWLGTGLFGFALVIWSLGSISIGQSFVVAGSSIFTLGFANRPGLVPSTVAFLAAAFGLVVVALQIAYLPALYDAFNRRETLVTMLESRAGTPAWGPELLVRHRLVGTESNLAQLYADWERWAADVAESHSTYPALLALRSPHRDNSWIVALCAVMDSAALFLALSPSRAPVEARLCVRMGFTCLRDLARALGIAYDPDPRPSDPITLTYGEFLEAVERMRAARFPIERDPRQAWPHFCGWRVNYEHLVNELAYRFSAPAAPWTGPRRAERGSPPKPRRPVDRQPSVTRTPAGGDSRGERPTGDEQ